MISKAYKTGIIRLGVSAESKTVVFINNQIAEFQKEYPENINTNKNYRSKCNGK